MYLCMHARSSCLTMAIRIGEEILLEKNLHVSIVIFLIKVYYKTFLEELGNGYPEKVTTISVAVFFRRDCL